MYLLKFWLTSDSSSWVGTSLLLASARKFLLWGERTKDLESAVSLALDCFNSATPSPCGID